MYCQHCGTANVKEAHSCSRCGERIYAPDPKKPPVKGLAECPACSSSNRYDALYCWDCGKASTPGFMAPNKAEVTERVSGENRARQTTSRPTQQSNPSESNPSAIKIETHQALEGDHQRSDPNTDPSGILPDELNSWNWGAFLFGVGFLAPVWSIANGIWLGCVQLIFFIPAIPLPARLALYISISLLLGLKGNEWAWRSRRWENQDHFLQTQRQWTIWGVPAACIGIVILVVIWIASASETGNTT